ncbi:MAG: MBL fold metallo-hydrolase [Ruminiclostridium sp.]|nr:MBL fold metallo-hydrolase [Ruminiclostridium sp.]
MRIVALIENTSASEKLKVEHGISFFVESAGIKYLIDTGASDKLMFNAKRLGINMADISAVLISHNGYTHTGGLEEVWKANKNVMIYAKKACLGDFYLQQSLIRSHMKTFGYLYEEHPGSFILYNSFQQIDTGFFAMSNEHPDTSFYCEDKSLFMKKDGKIVRDDFSHESFYVIFPDNDRKAGAVIISPCSLCGITNMMKTVKKRFPGVNILSVIGGFHLMGTTTKKLSCSVDHVEKTVNEIMTIDTGTIYTCHCTGLTGYGIMKQKLGNRLQYLQTGEELTF